MNRHCIHLALVILLSIFISNAFAQSSDFFSIKGKVVDASDNEPLPFAHVQIKNTGNGTVTNEEGEFVFKISKEEVNSSLLVSFIGYEPYELLLTSEVDGYLIIPLKLNSVELDEVEVKVIDAVALLKSAVEKVPQNHAPDSVLSTAYFRYLVKQDSLSYHMEEFVFKSYKDAQSKGEQLEKLKGRFIRDEEMFATPGNTRFSTGVPNSLHGVNIFTTFPFRDAQSIISKKDYSKYDFELEDITTYNNRSVYVIAFDQKDNVKESLFKGQLYIDQETLGFLSIKSKVSPKGKKYISKSGRYGGPYMILEEDNEVNYQLVDGKWYLSNISFHLEAENFQRDYITELTANCLITDIQTKNVTPIIMDKKQLKKGFKEINKGSAKPWDLRSIDSFWEGYNFLELSDDWVKMAEEMFIRNQKWEAASKNSTADIKVDLIGDEQYALDLLMQKAHNNGVFNGSILIAKEGEAIYKGGFGFADIENKKLNTPSKPYPIFSVSKPFTAIRIFQLIEEGKLSLEDKVMQYFPNYEIPQFEQVTVEQLLTHTSGIPDFINNNSVAEGEQLTEEIFMQKLKEVSLEFESGTQFSYANSTYIFLSFLIEKITQKSFSKNIKENIINVAAMNNAGVKTTGNRVKNISKNYIKVKDKLVPIGDDEDLGVYKGGGAIYASPEDLLEWGNVLSTDILLSSDSKQKMWSSTALQTRYAYGWSIFEIPQIGSFRGHIGGLGESLRTVVLQEVNNKYFIVLNSNTGLDYETIDLMLNKIFKVLSKGESPDFSFDELTALE